MAKGYGEKNEGLEMMPANIGTYYHGNYLPLHYKKVYKNSVVKVRKSRKFC